MTSLDDSIISKQNIMLLDNVTNYSKCAIDYFHCNLKDNEDLPLSWSLLCKMKKHKLLRLPSCSIEDDIDYNMYLQRLHHCLWRRWSMDTFNLNEIKLDPLDINWNKNTDVTVLYGPDLSLPQYKEETAMSSPSISIPKTSKESINDDTDSIHSEDSTLYASSIDSSTSSIFDSNNSSPTTTTSVKKSLRFNDIVKRRDVSMFGENRESYIQINDKLHLHKRSRRHKARVASSYYTYNVDLNDPSPNTINNDPNDFMFNVM
ncbi:hypothetical protein MOUN0_H03334 [Monosporozyma unispora]|nr:hypothetical protein C6P44_004514 [Kazachstania unispora]